MPSPTIRQPGRRYWRQRRRSWGCQTNCVDRRTDGRKAAGAFAEREALRLQQQSPVPRTAKCPRAAKASGALGSVGGGFGGGMQAVLRDFVDAASGRLDALAVKVIERDASFPDRIALLDGFGDVSLRQGRRFEQRPARGKLCGKRRSKGAARPVGVLGLHPLAA